MTGLHLLGPVRVGPIEVFVGDPVLGHHQVIGVRVEHDGRLYEVVRGEDDPHWAHAWKLDHIDAWLIHVHGVQRIDERYVPTRLAFTVPDGTRLPTIDD